MTQKTKREIIDETIAYYSEDVSRRAVKGHRCVYMNFDSPHKQMCAVGRCIDYTHEKATMAYKSLDTASGLIREFSDNIFLPEYRGHDRQFWKDLQSFHDNKKNWNNKANVGLSDHGEHELKRLCKKWSDK